MSSALGTIIDVFWCKKCDTLETSSDVTARVKSGDPIVMPKENIAGRMVWYYPTRKKENRIGLVAPFGCDRRWTLGLKEDLLEIDFSNFPENNRAKQKHYSQSFCGPTPTVEKARLLFSKNKRTPKEPLSKIQQKMREIRKIPNQITSS